jgi:hypothetical protein
MIKLFIFIATLSFGPNSADTPVALNKIYSKDYCLAFSSQRTDISFSNTLSKPRISQGLITRSGDYMNSNVDSSIGILEDTTCLYVDKEVQIITLGPKSTDLVSPMCDPLEIISYAIQNKMNSQTYVNGADLIYQFDNQSKGVPVIKIEMRFRNSNDGQERFTIVLTYHQVRSIIRETVKYQFTPDCSNHKIKMISDFLDKVNGKYQRKKEYKNYVFLNSFLHATKL